MPIFIYIPFHCVLSRFSWQVFFSSFDSVSLNGQPRRQVGKKSNYEVRNDNIF